MTDTDHHLVDLPDVKERRSAGAPVPREEWQVTIGDDVFIGTRSIILKGVTVGRGTTIAAGSVVTRDLPAMVVAAGNPARVVRSLRAD